MVPSSTAAVMVLSEVLRLLREAGTCDWRLREAGPSISCYWPLYAANQCGYCLNENVVVRRNHSFKEEYLNSENMKQEEVKGLVQHVVVTCICCGWGRAKLQIITMIRRPGRFCLSVCLSVRQCAVVSKRIIPNPHKTLNRRCGRYPLLTQEAVEA